MDDFDITGLEDVSSDDFKGFSDLALSVIIYAFNDAIVKKDKKQWENKTHNRYTAREFIDEKNKKFRFWCELAGYDPYLMASTMQDKIKKMEFKPLEQLRE